jgi:NADH dehydrogenase
MTERSVVLLAGGGGGLVGRAVSAELARDHEIRSVHRHRAPNEPGLGVRWVPGDITGPVDWDGLLDGVDVVVNLAWYRWGSERRFRRLYEGLRRLLEASVRRRVPRFLQLSVPAAPVTLETGIPYLTYKRRFDRELAESGLSYAILRPTMMFGERDVLLGVMMRTIHRYPFFLMFGDGNYRLSPIAAADVARIVRRFSMNEETGTFTLGGPVAYRYHDLTDQMFRLLGKRPRYWRLRPMGSRRLAWLLQGLGSTLLYEYEVEWLLSDMLAPPAYEGLDRPLERVEPYLAAQARRLGAGPPDPDHGSGGVLG